MAEVEVWSCFGNTLLTVNFSISQATLHGGSRASMGILSVEEVKIHGIFSDIWQMILLSHCVSSVTSTTFSPVMKKLVLLITLIGF